MLLTLLKFCLAIGIIISTATWLNKGKSLDLLEADALAKSVIINYCLKAHIQVCQPTLIDVVAIPAQSDLRGLSWKLLYILSLNEEALVDINERGEVDVYFLNTSPLCKNLLTSALK